MTSAFDGYNYVLRLNTGELICKTLVKFAQDNNIKGGFVSGIGGLAWAEIGFYDLTAKAYAWSRFDEPLELLSLNGNLAWKEKEPFLHLHASVSDASQYARGGHLNEAAVGGNTEIFIHMWNNKDLKRSFDKQTGLYLFDL